MWFKKVLIHYLIILISEYNSALKTSTLSLFMFVLHGDSLPALRICFYLFPG